MPLSLYRKGTKWWVRGRCDGIDSYLDRSLKTSEEAVARAKLAEIERKARQRAVLGNDAPTEADELTFAAACVEYPAKPADAGYLLKVIPYLGEKRVKDIKPKEIRNLGKLIYPHASTDTWRRQVATPVSAAINFAHQEHGTPPIRVKAYTVDERLEQDQVRGKKSRQRKTPGSWEWLDKFKAQANPYAGALALFMFTTGSRITQALEMVPNDLDLMKSRVFLPAAKKRDSQWVEITTEMVVTLANLPPRNGRVFGYASRHSVYNHWMFVCKEAGIEYIAPHAAGRHGFGTEAVVRQGLNPVDVAEAGRWSSPRTLLETYAHSEDGSRKVRDAFTRSNNGKSAKAKQQ